MKKLKSVFQVLLALSTLIGLAWLVYILIGKTWTALISVNKDLAVAMIMAAATVLAATVTVMLGRYYERKREIEAHFRANKIEIYDQFLQEFFRVFHKEGTSADDSLVDFLREWQRKLVLWGGDDVLQSYFTWMNRLKNGNPDAQTVFLMDVFFRSLRKDIGQTSGKVPKGGFANLILRHGEFFLKHAAQNPSITLAELGDLEKAYFKEGV